MFTTISQVDLTMLSPNALKQKLIDSIAELADNIDQHCSNPGKDFSRSTKLGLNGLIWHFVCMGSKDTRSEIADLVPLEKPAYTDSAITMARRKLNISGMEFLFHNFTDKLNTSVTIKGYTLCAVDGTDLNIYLNPEDPETFVRQREKSGYNQFHINVAFNPLTNIVVDFEIDTKRKKNEAEAFMKMFNTWSPEKRNKSIYICDRGYISYRLIDFLNCSGAKYLLRAKDITGKSMFSGLDLPDREFDMEITRILTRKHNKEYMNNRKVYTVLESNVKFDMPPGIDEYPLTFRLVRVLLSTGEYELLVTNLSEEEFSKEDLKKLYNLRWNLEINNKEAKYSINLVDLHSRKQNYIRQEIYARYLLLNFTNAVTFGASFMLRRIDYSDRTNSSIIRNTLDRLLAGEVISPTPPPEFAQYSDEPLVSGKSKRTRDSLPVYKIDFSSAATNIRKFLKEGHTEDEFILARIIKFLVLVQPGRSYDRDVKPQSNRKFSYRGS